jgi:hypothetical protein
MINRRAALIAWNSTLPVPSSFSIRPTCPETFEYYICSSSSTPFSGCCADDPCDSPDNGVCSELAPAFVAGDIAGNTFPAQDCEDGGTFYACDQNGGEQFMGCCKSNACAAGSNGCPAADLVPMLVAANPANRAAFLSGVGFVSAGALGPTTLASLLSIPPELTSSSSSPTQTVVVPASTGTSSGTTTSNKWDGTAGTSIAGAIANGPSTTSSSSSATSSTSSPANFGTGLPGIVSNVSTGGSKGLSTGAQAGIIVGSLVVACMFLSLILFLVRRRKTDPQELGAMDDFEKDIPGRPQRPHSVVSMDGAVFKPLDKKGPEPKKTWRTAFKSRNLVAAAAVGARNSK